MCAFNNPKVTVAAIIIADGRVLVSKRAKEPEIGKWDFFGGFANANETPEQAIKREIKEELGVEVKRLAVYTQQPGTYEYDGRTFALLNTVFFVELVSDQLKLNDESTEVAWVDPRTLDVAFDSQRAVLKRFLTDCYIDIARARELTSQLDPSAHVDEFAVYQAQTEGYCSKQLDENGRLIGMGWIFPRQTMLRRQAVVEDMIVDQTLRGRGLGKLLINDLLRWAAEHDIEMVELTSNPKRVPANELYKKVGFKLHPTNHYLYAVTPVERH